jgi:predicted nucleic acid-binding protein
VYLLDTNVVSELRRARPHGAVLAWIAAASNRHLHISAVTIGELQAGAERTRDQDAAKAGEIEAWIELVEDEWDILAMDADAFRIWARLMHRRPETLLLDAMIAATAIVHGLTVVTRNLADFKVFDVPVLDPFAPA